MGVLATAGIPVAVLALLLALAAPVGAEPDGGRRAAVAATPDGGPRAPMPAAGDVRARGDPVPPRGDPGGRAGNGPADADAELLRDLDLLMLFELLRDYDLFADEG